LPLYSLNIQRQRIESSDSEEDDDSDVPLAKRPRRKQEVATYAIAILPYIELTTVLVGPFKNTLCSCLPREPG
jgi:hypothetical protein